MARHRRRIRALLFARRAAAFLLRRPRQVQGFREHLANNLALPLLGG
ncbi:MAG: hypothetical protein ACK40D_07680 [Cyanobacteriota bacterium]|jgi:hypothetical protein